MWKRFYLSIVVLSLLFLGAPAQDTVAQRAEPEEENLKSLAADLERLRQNLKIPGMSAAVVQDQALLWAAGFGYADLENRIAAGPDTPYGLASVTKPLAAVIIMQLAAEGAVDLEAPVAQYGVNLPGQEDVTVRHLLTHTSEGVPGTIHTYNGGRYGLLGGVMEGATGQTFAALLRERVIGPLGMTNTALNPINHWSGVKTIGWEDFIQGLCLDVDGGQCQDVYRRLARPYQFDSEYNTIPGMYHLYHNPGAGVVSSVTDLARFDIALDQGLLLNKTSRIEMFTPAFSTYPYQSGLMYGLGWYVQEFEGRQLLWHCGRWSPSTSALFLKVPEEDLTFIVLANTDNLTVPFNSIGWGDITKSALVLSFFRHFVYPRDQGTQPPPVDWEADGPVLIEQLAGVEDEAARTFLERELWSYRQVFASVGRQDRVDLLNGVSLQAFPLSNFRADPLFKNVTGQLPVIDPGPSAATFLWMTRGIALWLVAAVISTSWLVVRLLRRRTISPGGIFRWLLAGLLLGPLALALHGLTAAEDNGVGRPPWRRALGSAAECMSVFALGWAVAMGMLLRSSTSPQPEQVLGFTYLVPLLVGFFCAWGPALVRRNISEAPQVILRGLLAEIITYNLAFAVFLPLSVILSNRWFTILPPPASPYFWGMLSVMAAVGVVVVFPLHYLMRLRGLHMTNEGRASIQQLPTLRNAWGYLVASLGIAAAGLVAAINQIG